MNDLTSTPRMRTDNSNPNFYSDVSSPESFCGPEFSPLSVVDSPESSPSHSLVDQEHPHTTNNTQDLQQNGGNNSIEQNSNQVKGVKIVGDNIDKSVKPRFMRSDHQNKSLHYFHCYAVRDRFDLSMPDEYPDIPDQPKLEDLLPSESDISKMKAYFAIHVARTLCKYMSYFTEDFSDVIPEHLEHVMSSQMSLKSDVVSDFIRLEYFLALLLCIKECLI